MSLLQVSDLSVSFPGREGRRVRAVDSVSFSIERQQTHVLLGESGCGKSMTAMAIMRLLPHAARVDCGSVMLNGSNLLQLPERQMRSVRGGRIGMIFQEPQSSLNPVLSIGEQIAEVLQHHRGMRGAALRQRVHELLEAVGISEPGRRYREYPHQFSGGMKQRVMIAMALAAEPDVLIADEPTTALDVTIQAQVLQLMQDLQRQLGMAILFITHDLGVASRMADEVTVMYQGGIVEQAPRERFFAAPAHAYSQLLFERVPSRNKRRQHEADCSLPDTSGTPLLAVSDLKVHFPVRAGLFRRVVDQVRAVDGVDLEVHAGETVALVGESGSGKTTMGKGILRLFEPTSGRVLFEGSDLAALDAAALRRRRSDLQIVFQDPYSSMNPRMMIADIIMEGMIAQGIGAGREQRLHRVDELLRQVELEPEMKFRYPHEFSGGQRQRVCIARALAVEPKLIICDEPTSALDVSVQAQILDLLRSLQQRLGLSYLLITHNIAVVEYLAHRVAVMYRGKLVEQGPVEDIIDHPEHEYTRQLLSAVPKIERGEASSGV